MRYAVAAMILATAATGVRAQPADNAFASYRAYSCRAFIANPQGKRQVEVGEAVEAYVSAYDGFEPYVSYCTTTGQVRAECQLDPRFTVGDAVDRLFAKKRNGIPLPMKRACGA